MGQRGELVMPRLLSFAALALLILAAGTSCTGGGKLSDVSPAAGGGAGLGQTLAGETCRIAPIADGGQVPAQLAPLDITCGEAGAPVGTLWVSSLPANTLPGDLSARHAAIADAVGSSTGGRRIAERLACDAG